MGFIKCQQRDNSVRFAICFQMFKEVLVLAKNVKNFNVDYFHHQIFAHWFQGSKYYSTIDFWNSFEEQWIMYLKRLLASWIHEFDIFCSSLSHYWCQLPLHALRVKWIKKLMCLTISWLWKIQSVKWYYPLLVQVSLYPIDTVEKTTQCRSF